MPRHSACLFSITARSSLKLIPGMERTASSSDEARSLLSERSSDSLFFHTMSMSSRPSCRPCCADIFDVSAPAHVEERYACGHVVSCGGGTRSAGVSAMYQSGLELAVCGGPCASRVECKFVSAVDGGFHRPGAARHGLSARAVAVPPARFCLMRAHLATSRCPPLRTRRNFKPAANFKETPRDI